MAAKNVFTVLIPTSGAPVFLDHQISLLRRFSAEQLDIVVVNDARPYAHLSIGWTLMLLRRLMKSA
jgi:hypothetical protein